MTTGASITVAIQDWPRKASHSIENKYGIEQAKGNSQRRYLDNMRR